MKKIILVIWILVLLAGQGWGADLDFYDYSDSGNVTTYGSWALMDAAETPSEGDIIDLLDNTLIMGGSVANYDGASGNRLTVENGIFDGTSTLSRGMDTQNSDHVAFIDLEFINFTGEGFYSGSAANTDYYLRNIAAEGNTTNIYLYNDSDIDAKNLFSFNSTGNGIIISGCTGSYVGIYSFNSASRGVDFTGGSADAEYVAVNGTTTEGIRINNMTAMTLDYPDVQNAGTSGISIGGSIGAEVFSGRIINSGGGGYNITGASNNVVVTDSYAGSNLTDNYSVISSTGAQFHRNIADLCGTSSAIGGTGDAFTSHAGCTGQKFHFNLSRNNLHTGQAHVDGASGEIYHHTSINDGKHIDADRAAIWIPSIGAWTLKNNLVYNNFGYPVAESPSSGTENITADYNTYISNVTNPFIVGASTGQTWSQWIAGIGGETNSWFILEDQDAGTWKCYKGSAPTTIDRTLTYCPVTLEGKLVAGSDNPLISGGVVIAGANDSSSFADVWGNVVRGTPNIGCNQRGATKGGNRILRIGGGIGF